MILTPLYKSYSPSLSKKSRYSFALKAASLLRREKTWYDGYLYQGFPRDVLPNIFLNTMVCRGL